MDLLDRKVTLCLAILFSTVATPFNHSYTWAFLSGDKVTIPVFPLHMRVSPSHSQLALCHEWLLPAIR
jgi:hypothetical protein